MPADSKLLLLQIRDNPTVRQEEHHSFARYSGIDPDQITLLNVFDQPCFPIDSIVGYDALLVGGASESVLEPSCERFRASCEALLLHCLEQHIPVFASCFGFQLAAQALGGRVVRDGDDFEMGTPAIQLTSAAKDDTLFHDMPNPFRAVAVHRDLIVEAPPGCVSLAYTKRCCHAFRVEGRPFWAFQFHPEVDHATLVERLTYYRHHYTQDEAHLTAILAATFPTPEANALAMRFMDRVLS